MFFPYSARSVVLFNTRFPYSAHYFLLFNSCFSQLGDAAGDPLAVDMLVDYVTGNLGGKDDQSEAANIVKVLSAWFSDFGVWVSIFRVRAAKFVYERVDLATGNLGGQLGRDGRPLRSC